jgi:hypothetical protein
VHRLASLFWPLRRATSIETGLLRMQSEILRAFKTSRPKPVSMQEEGEGASLFRRSREATSNRMFSTVERMLRSLTPTLHQPTL